MWLSKLNQMSVGPLWVLRVQPDHAAAFCPVCGDAWLHPEGGDNAVLVVLVAPIIDQAQQILLQNCLRSAGMNDCAYLTLHGNCTSGSDAAIAALQKQIADRQNVATPFQTILVFGDAAAQRINPEFDRGQIHQYQHTRLIVTHHPEQMIADPSLKAQVWADLCLALTGREN